VKFLIANPLQHRGDGELICPRLLSRLSILVLFFPLVVKSKSTLHLLSAYSFPLRFKGVGLLTWLLYNPFAVKI